jgi:pimeloyl-ACP methyl ester carboxylesterase/DNA-binding CsgD family transcriptional regulator
LGRNSQQIRFCHSADGVRVAYAKSGSGPALVMTANWLTHLEYQWQSLAWKPWLEALSSRYALLRYDSRGCGLSDWDASEISVERWVNDLEAVVDAAGYKRFPLLGVCQGGPIAIEYAARHPERVSCLVLFGTYARGRMRRGPQEAEVARLTFDLMRLGWANETHAFMHSFAMMWQPGGSLEHLRSWCELQRATTSADNAVRLMKVTYEMDVSDSAARVVCPTLVIHPDRDRVVPLEEARRLAALIPGARFMALKSENHMPLEEEPAWQRFVDELQAFVPPERTGAARLSVLSERELQVLEHLARGEENAQIAAQLGLSEKTVRNHVSSIFAKLEVKNRARAIVLAREAGLGMKSA